MLRAKDGSSYGPVAKTARRIAVALMLAVGTFACVFRATVQNNSVQAQPLGNGSTTSDDFDPSQLPLTEHGAFIVRPAAFLNQPDVQSVAKWIEGAWANLCKTEFGANAPPCRLEDIEVIAGGLRVDIDSDRFTATSDVILIRFCEGKEWKSKLLQLVPSASEYESPNGPLIVGIPPIGFWGPEAPLVRFLDDRTLLFAMPQTGRKWVKDHSTLPTAKKKWSSQWKVIDGGVLTVLCDTSSVTWPKERAKWRPVANELIERVRLFALTIHTKNGIELECDVVGKDRQSALALKEAVENLIGKVQVPSIAENEVSVGQKFYLTMARLLSSATVRVPDDVEEGRHLVRISSGVKKVVAKHSSNSSLR